MTIKGTSWDPLQVTDTTRKTVPQNIASEARFLDILAMMQDDGLVAKNASPSLGALTDEQKSQIKSAFSIDEMAAYTDKRALLNQLVQFGALSAEESELSMFQLLPPQGTNAIVQTGISGMMGAPAGWDKSSEIDSMLSEPNYLSYLEKAIDFDHLWSRSDDVKNARLKLYDILSTIYT